MREIRVTAPAGRGADVARLALDAGITEVSVHQVYVHGPDEHRDTISAQAATPEAAAFVNALLAAPFFDPARYSVGSDSQQALISSTGTPRATRPMPRPGPDIAQDLWQRVYLAPGFLVRALGSGLLLSYGMMQNSLVTVVAGLLFSPFLLQILAAGFGGWTGDRRLAFRGWLALGVSTALTAVAGTVVASLTGGPLLFQQFDSLAVNLLISLIVGFTAGVDLADDSGRIELLGLIAASRLAPFAAWVGISAVIGFPDAATTVTRLVTFTGNTGAILAAAVAAFYFLRRWRPRATAGFAPPPPSS